MPADYQTFDLSGSHYDLGFAQGARSERFEVPTWWPAPPGLDFAQACARQIAEVHPPLLEELHGYADGQRLPYEELLRGVCRRSMRLRARMPAYPEGGCSSFAFVDSDHHVRAGRNYDFHPVQRVRQRLRLKPDRGRPSLGMRGSVPGGRYDGVNDAGLFICLHVALSEEPQDLRPGIPFHLLPRLALETCASARQAADLLTHVRHLHPFNYLLADASGAMFVVEAHPQCVRVIEPERESFIAATNHFRHPNTAGFQRGRKLTHSHERLAFLYTELRAACRSERPFGPAQGELRREERLNGGRDASARFAGSSTTCRLLADHTAHLCGHTGGHTTLWSLAADLTARTIAYARGAPCQTAYERVAWPE